MKDIKEITCVGTYSNIGLIFKTLVENIVSDIKNANNNGETITISHIRKIVNQLESMLNNTLSNIGFKANISLEKIEN